MKQHIVLLTFLVFFNGSFSLDPFYEDCVPKHCGDGMSIRFPFFIRGIQESHCGYPGFELVCNQYGIPVLNISANYFSFENIDYKAGSMRLLYSPAITCLSAIKNVTLEGNLFWIDRSLSSELIFLTDCSKELPKNLTRYRIGSCDEDPAVQLVMLSDDANLGIAKEVCTHVVVAPVEEHGGEGRGKVVVDGKNYAEVAKRGFTLFWPAQECVKCERSGGRCGYQWFKFQFLCFCPHSTETESCPNGTRKKELGILVTALTVGFMTILAVIILCFIRKFRRRRNTKNCVNVENFLKNHEFLAKRYSYLQVKKMTNTFEVKLGQGGFGSVYRGELSNGNLVAVKILSKLNGNIGEDFINEVASIGRTSHVNIVSLVGFCFEGHRRALIYEFMPNGSLEKFIYDPPSSCNSQLGWAKLYAIAIGIARGLEYLHNGCNTRILHFDIKPHNILLDKDFFPKISDFGLAKLSPDKRSIISMSHMRGTPGYIAPELYSRNFGQVSHKSDVYSYGMMILEMVGGRKNIEVEVDHSSEIYFPHWIYKKIELDEDFGLHIGMSDEENDMVRKMIIVGLWCIQTNPLNRPTIAKALEMLEGDLTSLEIPPKPYLTS